MGTGAEVALIALTVASTAYTASQAGKTPDMPTAPDVPKQPVSPTMDINVQNKLAQRAAESAGGTLLAANQGEGTGTGGSANPGNKPAKSLLGV